MSASLPVLGKLVLFAPITSRPARKPTDGTYCFFSRSATALCSRFHCANFSNVPASRQRLDSVPPAPLRYRRYFLRRQCGQRALVPLPPLLQSCGLGPRCPVPVSGQIGRYHPHPGRDPVLGRRRFVVS